MRPGTSGPGPAAHYRLYHELAEWWPLISPPREYAEDAASIRAAFGLAEAPVRDVLDLGSGGGGIAVHLKDRLALTLVDISERMLEVSRALNPECEHVCGDMRTVRLGRLFDAVLVHDAIDYVTDLAELKLVIQTAYAHCRPGGLAVFTPDHTAETFRAGAAGGGGSGAGGRQASFQERTSDPDPADDWIVAEYEFTLRDRDGCERVVREAHRLGSFRRDSWLQLLAAAGFAVRERAMSPTAGDALPSRVMFVGTRQR